MVIFHSSINCQRVQLWPWLLVITGYFYEIIHSINGVIKCYKYYIVLIAGKRAVTVSGWWFQPILKNMKVNGKDYPIHYGK